MSNSTADSAGAEDLIIAFMLRRLLKMQRICQRCTIYVMKHLWSLSASAILAFAMLLNACLGTPGTTLTNAGEVVYLAGPKQETVTVTLVARPDAVFDSIIRMVLEAETTEVIQRNNASRMIEVTFDGRSLNAQVTEFGDGESLLFLWADAGDTGLTGKEVAMSTIDKISKDLNARYELVEN
jgi:hypothetical protein